MMSLRHSTAASAAATTLTLTLAAGGAAAQNVDYTPEDGDNLVNSISVRTSPGGQRVNENDDQIGRIGVTRCRELLNNDNGEIQYTIELNPNFSTNTNSAIEFEGGDTEGFFLEFPAETGIDGSCNRTDEKTACDRFDDDTTDFSLTRNNNIVEGSAQFETMLSFDDDATEPCEFTEPSETQSLNVQQGMLDAGDAAGGGDANVTDTGTTTDTGITPIGGGSANSVYVFRFFINGVTINPTTGQENTEEKTVDAPLLIDRTRPPAPGSVNAGATENTLRVQFEEPSATGDIDNYHVFFSTDPISDSATPEELDDSESVTRRTLTGITDEDGILEADVDIDLPADGSLFVAVSSRDRAENFSLPTLREQAVSIQDSTDFWENYQSAGGAETGGCGCRADGSGQPASLLVLLVGLGGLMVRRRR